MGKNRPGSEHIEWTDELLEAFYEVQRIFKDPTKCTHSLKGDECFIANDAYTIVPGMAVKLFIKRPGVQNFLPTFNFGFRLRTHGKNGFHVNWKPRL